MKAIFKFLVCILVVVSGIRSKSVAKSSGRLGQRIVGGSDANLGEFPHAVIITHSSNVYCAASIVHPEWVVTAAQCGFAHLSSYVLAAGVHNRYNPTGSEQYRYVDRIVIHPRYEAAGTVDHEADVALMHVTEPFAFNEFVQPAILAESGFQLTQNATVIGWGQADIPTLQKVSVPFVDDSVCAEAYGQELLVSSMTCYGEANKDACTGDSGAPLMCGDTVCGLASWGFGCGIPGYPSVYSEMSYFSNWVLSQVNPREEDPFPVITILDCGGKINSTSARISINSPLGETTRCSWLTYVPLANIRVVLRSFLQPGSSVHITEFDRYLGHPGASRPVVLPNQNNTVNGSLSSLFIISMTSSPDAAETFTIEIFGSGVGTYTDWDNAVPLVGATGSYSYPESGGLYDSNEVSHFLYSPSNMEPKMINFTRMSLEQHASCNYDSLNLYVWNGTDYLFHRRYCGWVLPEPADIPFGEFLLLFNTDSTISLDGFAFYWY